MTSFDTTDIRTGGPIAVPATSEASIRASLAESPIYRAMPTADLKLNNDISQIIASGEHAVLPHESDSGIDGVFHKRIGYRLLNHTKQTFTGDWQWALP